MKGRSVIKYLYRTIQQPIIPVALLYKNYQSQEAFIDELSVNADSPIVKNIY
jgi:hypothetical protein